MPLSLADVLSAQAGGGPVYEGGPDANVTPGGVLTALGLGGPSWLERAGKQGEADWANYQRGGVPAMFENTQGTQDLASGFGGGAIAGPIKAYHGSPYDFAKFDLSKIGTGEGAQSYGHGLYFAENPAVAETYKATGYQAPPLSPKIGGSADLVVPPGKMYEVNINAEPGQFLQWDKAIRDQPQIAQALQQRGWIDKGGGQFVNPQISELSSESGQGLIHSLSDATASQRAASEYLNQAGIPGIRYLDQGSRGGPPVATQFNPATGQFSLGEPKADFRQTSNYVVFNPEIVDILKKYGLAGLTMGGVLTAAGQEPASSQ